MKVRKSSKITMAGLLGAGCAAAVLVSAAPANADGHDAATVRLACTVTVPWVVFDPTLIAYQEIRDAGLVPVVSGPATATSFVSQQSPVGGRQADCGSTVRLKSVMGPIP